MEPSSDLPFSMILWSQKQMVTFEYARLSRDDNQEAQLTTLTNSLGQNSPGQTALEKNSLGPSAFIDKTALDQQPRTNGIGQAALDKTFLHKKHWSNSRCVMMAGFFVETVVVTERSEDKSHIRHVFQCGPWLDSHNGNCHMETMLRMIGQPTDYMQGKQASNLYTIFTGLSQRAKRAIQHSGFGPIDDDEQLRPNYIYWMSDSTGRKMAEEFRITGVED
ncbi:hypothetical protein MAR_001685 [Mya arenaria]|uniref:Uncharacterized protein n=1 Tax=Mya arenaria TaxID=6604 RepID=A0ABY7FE46_MYAAR|nr:hypothetical protein MAR_001685 [Mya arenaria]